MKKPTDLLEFLRQKASYIRRETVRIHGFSPETRLASSGYRFYTRHSNHLCSYGSRPMKHYFVIFLRRLDWDWSWQPGLMRTFVRIRIPNVHWSGLGVIPSVLFIVSWIVSSIAMNLIFPLTGRLILSILGFVITLQLTYALSLTELSRIVCS